MLHEEGAAHKVQAMLAVSGELDMDRLRAALQELPIRHEILRTAFRSPPGVNVALQIIAPDAEVALHEVDAGALSPADQDATVERMFEEELAHVVDLGNPAGGAALRARVLRLGCDRHVLLLSAPAICVDGRSMNRLVGELAAAYRVAPGALQLDGEGDPVQYADFAQWQNDLLEVESSTAKEGNAYWVKVNDRTGAALRLPFERTSKGAARVTREWLVDESLAAALEALAAARRAPLAHVLLASWNAVLWRLAGEPDHVIVDAHLDGRKVEQLQSAIGCFGQYLPIRCALSDEPSLEELIGRVRAASQDTDRWQEYFSRAMRMRAGDGSAAHRIGFAHDEWPADAQAGDVLFRTMRLHRSSERLKLELSSSRGAGRLRLALRHDPTVYTDDSIDQLTDSMQALLEAGARDPERPIGELPITSEGARRTLLTRWNPPAPAAPEPRCVHELFEAQVRRTPHATALVFEDVELTYGELDRQANQLAHHLRGLGVGPDVIVGLLIERSAKMIVGMLAVLKAGGAYLPIEPSLPTQRAGLLLQQAGVRALLTEGELSDGIETAAEIVRLDASRDAIGRMSTAAPAATADERNLVYVIFTSGSTGTPKGVAVEHRQLVRYVAGAMERLQLDRISSFASVSTLAADLGHTSIFPALCSGGELHLISQERASDAALLASYFDERPVDLLKIVPSHLAALVQASPDPGRVMPRKRLVCGGELLAWGSLRVFQSHAPDCGVFNHYGPTETTVGVAAGSSVQLGASGLSENVPLGHPLAHAQMYLLDRSGQPVPVGVPGEIYIGGTTIARGYINRPDITAERFVPHPFSDQPGARLYRTGDRARYLPDGIVEFLGRVDRQVKLRGFRVELGEIESCLRRHEDVREAVVVMNDASGSMRLDAYVVKRAERAPSTEELRAHIKARLPDYMMPAHIVLLDRIPLTPNGKVNYSALPAPEHILASASNSYVAPRTQAEEIVAGIFVDMLGVERVGIHDDFFEIGGHSLLATRLLSRLREVFQVELSLRSIFEATTPAELAAVIESVLRGSEETLEPIPTASREERLPLSFAQERIWRQERATPLSLGLWLTGPVDPVVLSRSLDAIAQRHAALGSAFQVEDGQPFQLSSGLPLARLEVEPLDADRDGEGAALRRVVEEETRRPFELATGPLLRGRLLRSGPDRHLLLLTTHPLVADGPSLEILHRELAAIYDAFWAGRPSPLPEPGIQLADYAAWERGWLRDSELEQQLAYWTTNLARDGSPAPVATAGANGRARHCFVVPELTARNADELCRHRDVTVAALALAAWQLALRRATGLDDIVVGVPMTGRSHPETHGLVGPLASCPLVRAELSDDAPFRDLLARARAQILGASVHQSLPIESVAELAGWPSVPPVHATLSVESAWPPAQRSGPLTLERAWPPRAERLHAVSPLDLSLERPSAGGSLTGTLQYDTSQLEPSAAEHLADAWVRLLGAAVRDVDQRLSGLLY